MINYFLKKKKIIIALHRKSQGPSQFSTLEISNPERPHNKTFFFYTKKTMHSSNGTHND
jgi:hypothetical protein